MNVFKKLAQPTVLHLELSNYVGADPDKVRSYVADPGTLDKYCPGLTDTTVEAPRDGAQGVYRSTMKWLGVPWKTDMTWHPTEDGAELTGHWQGAGLRPFGETLRLSVQPASDGQGAVFSKTEDYTFPAIFKPIFPFLRYGLTQVSHQSAARLERLMQGKEPESLVPASLLPPMPTAVSDTTKFVSGSAQSMRKAGLPAIKESVSRWLGSIKPHGDDFKAKYGPWAVVTGASGSMGSEFARQLASQGLNVVLTARNEAGLTRTAQALEKEFGVQVRTVPLDLSQPQAAQSLDQATRDLDVGLLVNVAGDFQTGAFLGQDPAAQARLVDCNVKTPMLLAHQFGERLTGRHAGGIILTAAGSAFAGLPTVANYAASKAYTVSLAEGLAAEMRPEGVDVMALVVGPTPEKAAHNSVTSQGVDFSRSPIPTTSPEQVVSKALRDLGHKTRSIPGIYNRIAIGMQQHLSRDLNTAMGGYAVAQLQGYDSVQAEMEATR